MKKLIYVSALATLLLAACGDSAEPEKNVESTPATETENVEPKEQPKEETKEENEVTESEIGKMTVLHKNKELNMSFTTGPINGSLNKVQIATLEVAPDYKEMFDNQDIVTILTIETTIENTVDETVSFHPNQDNIVTDTGQQKAADLWLSDDVGGEFLGKVKKNGNIIWVLKHDENIKKVTLHASSAIDADYNNIGEPLKLEIPLQ